MYSLNMNFDCLGLGVERLLNWVHFVVVDSKNVKEFNFLSLEYIELETITDGLANWLIANLLVTRNLWSRQKSSEWTPMFIKFEGGRWSVIIPRECTEKPHIDCETTVINPTHRSPPRKDVVLSLHTNNVPGIQRTRSDRTGIEPVALSAPAGSGY